MLRLLALSLVLTAALAAAPAFALTPPGQAQAEGQRSSNKYALGADPGTADWTQGSQLPQGTGVQSASGDAFQNTASHPNSTVSSQPSSIAEGAAQVEDIAPASPNFVKTAGVHFTLDGSIRYFPGSNDYFLILRYDWLEDETLHRHSHWLFATRWKCQQRSKPGVSWCRNGISSVTDDQVRQFFQVSAPHFRAVICHGFHAQRRGSIAVCTKACQCVPAGANPFAGDNLDACVGYVCERHTASADLGILQRRGVSMRQRQLDAAHGDGCIRALHSHSPAHQWSTCF